MKIAIFHFELNNILNWITTDYLNWIIFWVEFSWNDFESNIELNQFWAKFKHWIESIWVSDMASQPRLSAWQSFYVFCCWQFSFTNVVACFWSDRRKPPNGCNLSILARDKLIGFVIFKHIPPNHQTSHFAWSNRRMTKHCETRAVVCWAPSLPNS